MPETLYPPFTALVRSSETPMTTIGDTVRVRLTVTAYGTQKDPSASVGLTVTSPDAVVHTISSGAIVQDQVGKYHADIGATQAGTWSYAWTAVDSDLGTITESGQFSVNPAPVTLTVTAQTTGGSPVAIEGARVEVWDTRENPIAAGKTDAAGHFRGSVGVGHYLVFATARGMRFSAAGVPLTVAANDSSASLTLSATPVTLTPPTAPVSVLLFGTLLGPTGAPAQGITVTLATLTPGYLPGGGTGIANQNLGQVFAVWSTRTDETGHWEVQVAAGSEVRVTIESLGYDKIFVVPDDGRASLNLADARSRPGDEAGVSFDAPPRDAR